MTSASGPRNSDWALLNFSEAEVAALAAHGLCAAEAADWRDALGPADLADCVASWQEAHMDLDAARPWILAGLRHFYADMVPAFMVRDVEPARVASLRRLVADPRELVAWLDALPAARRVPVLRRALKAGLSPQQATTCAALLAAPARAVR